MPSTSQVSTSSVASKAALTLYVATLPPRWELHLEVKMTGKSIWGSRTEIPLSNMKKVS